MDSLNATLANSGLLLSPDIRLLGSKLQLTGVSVVLLFFAVLYRLYLAGLLSCICIGADIHRLADHRSP